MFSNVVQTKAMKTCMKNLSMEYDGDLDNLSERALYLMDGNMDRSKVLLRNRRQCVFNFRFETDESGAKEKLNRRI